jgi:transcription initiation factor TFIID subunit 5
VYALSWSPESRLLLSGGGDGCIRLWDLGWSIAKHNRDTAATAAAAAAATAAAAAAAAAAGTAAAPLQNGAAAAAAATAAAAAANSGSSSSAAYQQPAARALAVYRGHKNAVWSVDFSPLGYYFASGGGESHVRTL